MVYQAVARGEDPDLRHRRDRERRGRGRVPAVRRQRGPGGHDHVHESAAPGSRSATASRPTAGRTAWRACASWSGAELAEGLVASAPRGTPRSSRQARESIGRLPEIKHLALPAAGAFDISPTLFGTGISGEGGRCVRLFLSLGRAVEAVFPTLEWILVIRRQPRCTRHSRKPADAWSSPSCTAHGLELVDAGIGRGPTRSLVRDRGRHPVGRRPGAGRRVRGDLARGRPRPRRRGR